MNKIVQFKRNHRKVPSVGDMENFKNLKLAGNSAKKIAGITGFGYEAVTEVLKSFGLLKKQKQSSPPVSLENKIKIIELYKSGLHGRQISEKFGCTVKQIDFILKKAKVIKRKRKDYLKYTLDIDFFKTIDTEEKAYFLGWMYSDGSVTKNGHSTRLELQARDGYILHRFKKAIRYGGPVTFCDKKTKNPTYQNSNYLNISCGQFTQHLINQGCPSNKSLILRFPTGDQVPKHLLRHFIRGYFDGDGNITLKKDEGVQLSIISSQDFCEALNQKMQKEFNIIIPKLYIHRNKITYLYRLYRKSYIKTFANFMYNQANPTLILKRKYDKFVEKFNTNFIEEISAESLDWIFINQNGEVLKVNNIHQFCEIHNLPTDLILKKTRTLYKYDAWRIYRDEESYERDENKLPTWSRTFSIASPNGEKFPTNNVRKFCKEHGLNSSCLSNVMAGRAKSHKGWTMEEIK